jgi:MFS family permease
VDTTAAALRVGFVAFIGGLGGGLVFPILPALGLQLGISSFLIGVILSANRVSRLAFDAPAGKLVDHLGGKRPLAWGLCLEALGIMGYSAGLHFGHVASWFLAGRIVFGIGSALLTVGAQAILLGLSTQETRGRLAAMVRMALSMGMPGGLVLGGVIADLASDDAAFWAGAAFTLAGAAIAWWQVPAPPAPRPRQTSKETATLFQRLRALPALAEFPVLAAAWSFNALIFFCVQGVLLATLVVLVDKRAVHLFAMGDQGTAGLIMAVLMACATAMAFALGRAIDRLPTRALLVLPSLLVLAAGFAVLASARTLPAMLAGTVLVGGSFNGVTLPMLALLGDVTRRHHLGRAVGIYQVFGDIGGSLGPIAGLEAGVRFGLPATYLGVAGLVAVGSLLAVWVYRGERRLRRRNAEPT